MRLMDLLWVLATGECKLGLGLNMVKIKKKGNISIILINIPRQYLSRFLGITMCLKSNH